jgi:glycosyltransferase involved in cell wall biosynthesis
VSADGIAKAEVPLSVAPVRVLLVGPSLDILGGQAIQLQRLLSRFRSTGSIDAGFLPVNPALPRPFGVLQRIKYVRTVVTSIAYVISLLRAVPRYDVIHAFSASYWSFLLAPVPAMIVGRLMRRRVVLNYRSGEARDHLSRWRAVTLPAMRLADAIVVPSGYLVRVFADFGLAARPILNFVDADRIVFRHRDVVAPVFLSNRNFQTLYNVSCTIRAFARIQEVVPDAQLIVAGFGPQRKSLETLVATLGVRNVDFRGKTPPEAMPGLYNEADIYLNSPDIDNMPNSVIEAFAAGLPVVTTNAGGIPYIVEHEHTGLLVDCDDDAALARQALRLLHEPGLASRLSLTSRQECLTRYVWSAVRAEWERLYLGLVRAPARSS